jgi:GGDEF domain-containing protein
VAILKGRDFENAKALTQKFNDKIKALQENPDLEYWEKISAAIGCALYDASVDASYDNIFKRADAEMYKNKKAMKAVRED